MLRTLLALIFVASGVTACGGPAANNTAEGVERACTPPRSHWLQQGPLDVGLTAPVNRLSVDRNSAIYWNGQPSSLSRVSQYLSVVATMRPRPFTFLETEMGTPCALIERVRDEMERRLNCRGEGSCAEGIWKVWQETPIPPGTPPS
ncbi:MAG: hypothetical protein QOJ53_2317 [Sphingomonadales bacterium]|jgi:hypothetical protein|nr:hypothetical protein [Sphingomonadales bacterium]MEA3044514.1 hypothetical protein [Sphingomonadales bacterium]MEA3047985.1 hypothetical protein [Sphingomonadales bacterium]